MYRLLSHCALTMLVCSACSGEKGVEPSKRPNELREPLVVVEADAIEERKSAKLVLVVILDQLGSNAFSRYAPHLPPDGVLRRAIDGGMYHPRVRYGYAGTNTAPGHASIFTGELPADHGIDANDIYNYEAGERMRIINDGEHAMFGDPKNYASPARLLKPTVGDRLHEERPGSKVISVSLKARAAVVSGGKTPDIVTWYNPDSLAFTTSSYYAKTQPSWLDQWNKANPVTERFEIWDAADPALLAKVNGEDDAPGEANWHGLGTTFPHDVANSAKPNKIFAVTPQSITYLVDMTRRLLTEYALGEDDIPDLLALSISTTDYAGHTFGIDSWEYLDILIKADKELTDLVAELEGKTELAVLITSDHGGTSLAEHSVAKGQAGGRLYADELEATLEAKADKTLGKGNWIRTYIQPYLYLHEDARTSPKRDALLALISKHAASDPQIEAIFAAEDARSWREDENWLRRDVANTVAPSTEALFVVPAEGHVASPAKGTLGTGHGTPWDSDREVPVLALGVGVTKSTSKEVLSQDRVAATIAALLGLSWHLPATPLPGTAKVPAAKTAK